LTFAVSDVSFDPSLSGKVANPRHSNAFLTPPIRRMLQLGRTSHARKAQLRLITSVVPAHDPCHLPLTLSRVSRLTSETHPTYKQPTRSRWPRECISPLRTLATTIRVVQAAVIPWDYGLVYYYSWDSAWS
jgi:hypothetical protein